MVVEPLAVRIDDHMDYVLHILGFVVPADSHLFSRVVLAAPTARKRVEIQVGLPKRAARFLRGRVPHRAAARGATCAAIRPVLTAPLPATAMRVSVARG